MHVESKLCAVTIYREGAVCTRRASLVGPVPRAVRVVGLPLGLAPGSVRARVSAGPPALRVLDVRAAFDVQLGEAADASTEERARDVAKAEIARLEGTLARLNEELRELAKLRPRRPATRAPDAPRAVPVEAALALATFADERMGDLHAERLSLERSLTVAREALARAEARLAEASPQARTQRARVTRALAVSLSAEVAGAVELELEYQVPGVRWAPSYSLRLDRDISGGTLLMRASVAQDTGEDWTGVALALSTAALAQRTDAPELTSLRVGRAAPEPRKAGFRAAPPGLEELFADLDRCAPREPLGTAVGDAGRRSVEAILVEEASPPPNLPRVARPPPASALRARVPPPPLPDLDDAEPEGAMAEPMAPRMVAAPSASRGGGGHFDALGAKRMHFDLGPAWPDDASASTGDLLGGALEGLPPSDFALSEALLDYGALELAGPEDLARRGRLTRVEHLGVTYAVGIHVEVVMSLVLDVQHRARRIQALALPPRCVPVASQDRFDFRYDCAAPIDVPSTGRWTTVPVMDCRLDLAMEYLSVPAVEAKVFRTLVLANTTANAWLPGPVDVLIGDDFLLSTSLPAFAPGARGQRLGLGVEEALKVARTTRFSEAKGGVFGGTTVLEHETRVELNNRLSLPATIEVRERVPQPEPDAKDIKVEEVRVEPRWEVFEGPIDGVIIEGLRRWRVTVAPGQRLTLASEIHVRIPADQMLVDGNRRA
jgi:hypothetical protein